MSQNEQTKPKYEVPVVVPLGEVQAGSAQGDGESQPFPGLIEPGSIEEEKLPGFTW